VIRRERPHVRIFPDPETLSRSAADFFSDLARKAIVSQGRFVVALSGGSTPRRMYQILGSNVYQGNIAWKQVHLFWADERCVPGHHPESNFKLVADTILSDVDIPRENIHRIRGEDMPDRAALEYEQDIRSLFKSTSLPVFDLIVLGAGEDGHTASLFSNSAALRENVRLAVPVYLEPPKLNRVTLTLPVLNHATHALFLASGPAKAMVIREIIENGNPKNYPAGLIHPERGGVIWYVDREAAGLLN